MFARLRVYSAPRADATQNAYLGSVRMFGELLVEIVTLDILLVYLLDLKSKSSSF